MDQCPHCHGLLPENAETCPNCGQASKVADPLTVTARASGRPLPLGDYIKTGWDLFKQYPGGFVGFFLIYVVISAILNRAPFLGLPVAAIISTPLMLGNFIVSAKLLQGQPVEFSDFFAAFNFFLPLVVVSVITSILVTLGLLLLVIPGIYLAVAFMFAATLVVDRGLDFWPAMDLSRRTVQPMWFGMFTFLLLLFLINLAGVLCLGLGLLVSAPLSFCALTAAYADIFGLQSDYSGKFPRRT